MRIYLDNAATTPMHPEVINHMASLMKEVYGNPSSIHDAGRKARTTIEDARKTVAKTLTASIGEIFFTGSATESNNMILRKAVQDLNVDHIIVSAIEHPCVVNTAKDLTKQAGIHVSTIEVQGNGLLKMDMLKDALEVKTEGRALVSIMHVNNEIGVIQDVQEIAKLCKEVNALFHCDAVQSIGKMPLNLQEWEVDFLSGTSHKFHGPKGVGFMFIRNEHTLSSFITGGGQEREMRSGTENVYGVAGLAKALEIYSKDQHSKMERITDLKKAFKIELKEALPGVSFIEEGVEEHFIPTILSVSFPENPKTELITFNLDISGISASAGSACSSGVEQASHVLEAIEFPEDRRAVRFSFSYFNTMEEITRSVALIKKMLS